jgi:hypothetical protein
VSKEVAGSLGTIFVVLGVSAEGTGSYVRKLSPEELDRQCDALAQ